MATVINNPAPTTTTDTSGSNMGAILGVILLIVLLALLVIYGIPYLGRTFTSSAPQVNVPGNVNVNVHTPTSK
jgi:hypothetical protein